ncbi:MAG: hypothetical protein A2X93_04820 [Deltaproteobacteria bacterium GWC2_56_8]|nr:MAG: hypothetical protein A2X99_10085 [Deltaproteobacteria bacterium GWB2_55_19]OGP36842.1 MAG: hypothetical protein A2X93_04820 [Deltaproteobacteria bacterium GWC2_56_8]
MSSLRKTDKKIVIREIYRILVALQAMVEISRKSENFLLANATELLIMQAIDNLDRLMVCEHNF